MTRIALANNSAGRTVDDPAERCHVRTGAGGQAVMGSRRGDASLGVPTWRDLGTASGSAAAARFYCGLFGWSVVARHRPLDDRVGYWTFQRDGTDVGGLTPARHAAWTVYVSVPDVDAAAGTVVDNGGAVLAGPMSIGAGPALVCTDPCGATFVVWQLDQGGEPRAADRPGTGAGTIGSDLLACRDVDVAKAFYGAVFGWEAVTTHSARGATATEWFRPGSGRCVARMVDVDARWPDGASAEWMPDLPVADTEATAARAAELGGTLVVAAEITAIGRLAVLTDAEGVAFAVSQPG